MIQIDSGSDVQKIKASKRIDMEEISHPNPRSLPAVSLNCILRQWSQRKEGGDKVTAAKYKQMRSYVRILTPRSRSERSIVIRKVVDGGGELIVDSLPCILGELPPMRDKVSLELVNCGIMAPRWRMRRRRGTPHGLRDTTR